MRLLARLAAVERRLPKVRPATVDLPGLYARLAAVGLAVWDQDKRYWSPADPAELRRLLAGRRA